MAAAAVTEVTEAEVLAEIRRIARRDLGFAGQVELDHRLVGDLNLDSMTLTVLGVALEDRFCVVLTDVNPEELQTVRNLVACIARKSASRAAE
jgi:acyl carrier protein